MTDFQPARPRRRFGAGKIILIVLAGLGLFGGGLFLILWAALAPVTGAGDAFMRALRDGNYSAIYAEAAPELKQVIGSAELLRHNIGVYRPSGWSWSQRSVRNGFGLLAGQATWQSGRTGPVELQLVKLDGQWRVTAFRLN